MSGQLGLYSTVPPTVFVGQEPPRVPAPWPRRMRPQLFQAPMDKFADASLPFTLDVSNQIDAANDYATVLSVSAAPSGAGELVISGSTMTDNVISFIASGGQPRRVYTIRMMVTMTNARIYEFAVQMTIAPLLQSDQPQPASDPGFGPVDTVTPTYAGSLMFHLPDNSSLKALI